MSISQNFPEEGPTLNLNFAGSKTLDPRITFSRTTTGTYMDANGLIVTAPADAPRFDHRYVNGEIESLGLLVEEDRSNLFTYSTFYGDNGLSNVGINTNVSGISAPDGTFTAAEMYGSDSTNNVKYMYKSYLTNTLGTYTTSVFMKYKNERYTVLRMNDNTGVNGCLQRIDIQNGIFTNPVETGGTLTGAASTITAYPNGWYRVSLTGTFVDALTQVQGSQVYITTFGATTSTNGIYLWGAQLEQGSFATSHIPRPDASTATRNHDRAYYENVDQTEWFNKTEGTLVFEHTDVPYSSSTSIGWPAVGFGETAGGGSNPSIQYFITKDYGDAQYLVRRFYPGGDSANITPPGGTGSAAPASKVGFVYKADDYALVRNGSLVGIDTSGAVPDAYTLIFGMNGVTATEPNWNAHLKNLQYYPTRLSNTVLQNLTK